MAAGKDDASTTIEPAVKNFAKNMDSACADLRKDRIAENKKQNKKLPDPPVITFSMSNNPISKSRTPAEQAAEVAAGKSWVCWSADMADKARHVIMKVNGTYTDNAKKAMGDDFAEFKKKWASAMSANSLKNFKGGDGWADGDSFHLELPDSKIASTDARAAACMEEYAKLTRKDGKPKNEKFEKDHAAQLAKFLAPYEKK